MDTETVIWLSPEQPTHEACLVCGNREANAIVLRAQHWMKERGYLDFARCGACHSGFFPAAAHAHAQYPASEENLRNPDFILLLHHYIELVAGLNWKVPLLERLPFERARSVLEVGCNLGVTLDYCRTAWGADVIGLEPSAYGLGGAKLLGVPILHAYLDEATELGERRFDIIFATEVIEHVADPLAFLVSMRRRLNPEGCVLLTTPRADSVSRDTAPSDLYATLSTGAHYFALSSEALADLLKRAGFTFIQLDTSGATHVAIASNVPLRLRSEPLGERLNRYYRARLDSDFSHPRVELAYLVHAYTTGVTTGEQGVVGSLVSRIDERLAKEFNVAMGRATELDEDLAAARTIFDFGRRVPYSLPLYLRARAVHLAKTAPGESHEYWALCALVCAHGLRADFPNLTQYQDIHREALEHVRGAPALLHSTRLGRELVARLDEANRRVPELSPRREEGVAAAFWAARGMRRRLLGRLRGKAG